MEEIEVVYCNDEEGCKELLNKLGAKQKILELFKTKKIEKIEIVYKKEPAQYKCTSSNN